MMGASYYENPAVFLINTVFGLYILAVMLRILFQWTGTDYNNPISQLLVKITHPPLRLLRRVIPPIGRVDTASIFLLFALQVLAGFLMFSAKGATINLAGLFIWSVAELLTLFLNVIFFAIIIRALLSWINPNQYNPATAIIYGLTEPILRLGRSILPPISGIDLSPLIILIGIQLGKMLLLPPLREMTLLFA